MSEMVERVARAICAEYGDIYDEQPADLPTLREWRKREGSADADGVGIVRSYDPGLPTQKDWQDMACAAIEAMREPTEAMDNAAARLTGVSPGMADAGWRAMIDAALVPEMGAEE